jgi:NAD(P)-dependent dehydrogenase (short-subunit alcohol dehydrogenase family)
MTGDSAMSRIHASQLLRPRLLEGVSILLAGASSANRTDLDGSLGDGVRRACARLGARMCELSLDVSGEDEEAAIEQAAQVVVDRALADGGTVELLVVDCASVFATAGGGIGGGNAREALRSCLDVAWNITRVVAGGAFLPTARGGRIVYLAPPADGSEQHVDAACAGLENLARTLSIEWARYGIMPVAIAPGSALGDADVAHEVAALVAYLASPAGAYFSGCLLDLRGARQSTT